MSSYKVHPLSNGRIVSSICLKAISACASIIPTTSGSLKGLSKVEKFKSFLVSNPAKLIDSSSLMAVAFI